MRSSFRRIRRQLEKTRCLHLHRLNRLVRSQSLGRPTLGQTDGLQSLLSFSVNRLSLSTALYKYYTVTLMSGRLHSM